MEMEKKSAEMEMEKKSKIHNPLLLRFDRAIRNNELQTLEHLCESLEAERTDLGYRLYQRAIDYGSSATVEILANQAVPGVEDGLFYAVALGKVDMVRTFIETSVIGKTSPPGVIFSTNGNHLRMVTPLMVASANDDLEITKILLENGHELPDINDLIRHCQSDYEKAATLVYWYRAHYSESYILLTSDDPLTVTFDHLKKTHYVDIALYPDLSEEMGLIEKRKGLLARDLLEKSHTKDEAASLLDTALLQNAEGSPDKCIDKSYDYIKINQSPCLDYKEFVGARRFQEYINDVWYQAEKTRFRQMTHFRFLALTCFICLLMPFLSVVYLLWPGRKTKGLLRSGYMKFLLHLTSDIIFVLLLISTVVDVRPLEDVVEEDGSLLSNMVKSEIYILYKSVCVNKKKFLILLWIFGMAGRRIQIMWRSRKSLKQNYWHVWDGLQILLYLIFVTTLLLANRKARLAYSTTGNSTVTETTPYPVDPTTSLVNDSFFVNGNDSSHAVNRTDLFGRAVSSDVGPNQSPPSDPNNVSPSSSFSPDYYVLEREMEREDNIRPLDRFLQSGWTWFRFDNVTTYDWSLLDPVFVSEAAFSVATIMTFLRMLHLCIFVRFLGPLKISLGGMFVQNIKFLTIFSFIWISFSMGLCQLYRSFEVLELYECSKEDPGDPDCENVLAFANLYNAMWSLFWSLFDLLDLELFEIDTERSASIQALGFFLYGFYMVVSVIILLNALIAMMSNHYTRIEENAEMEWRFARTELMIHFINHMPTVPPPLNLVWPIFRGIHLLIKKLGNFSSESSEHKGLHGDDCACKKRYKEAVSKVRSRLLQERYVELEERDRTKRQIDRLEKSLDELRFMFQEKYTRQEKRTLMKKGQPSVTEPDGAVAASTGGGRSP